MAENSSIQWTDSTFNCWRGCVKVSPACRSCYAERLASRNPKVLGVWGLQGTRVLAAKAQWRQAERWESIAAHDGTTPFVFCASLADVFEDWPGQMTDSQERPLWVNYPAGPEDYPSHIRGPAYAPYLLAHARARLWFLIQRTPHLRWQLLTKRPENIGRMMPPVDWPNVWLGTSVETQEYAWRIDALCEAPQEVPVRFISAEPLLGPLSLGESVRGLQWVICGGESGSQARDFHLEWARSLLAQCQEAGVPFFLKQFGKVASEQHSGLPVRRHRLALLHDAGHGGDVRDWPADLQVREMPPRNPAAFP